MSLLTLPTVCLFDTLLAQLVARLNSDAFFSDPDKGVKAIAANRMDFLTELDISLSKLGMALVLEVTNVRPDDVGAYHGAVVVTVTAQAQECPLINRAESGSQKTAQQILVKTRGLWDRPWTPDPNVWSPLQLTRFELTDTDVENARVIYTMEYETRTLLETVMYVLSTETGRNLVTQNGEQLFVSPTPP